MKLVPKVGLCELAKKLKGKLVIQSNVPKLGRYAEEFPYVAELLRASRPAIEEFIVAPQD